jgi:ubiquinone/menaquinone biosynthesis C-methylase UbiE
MQGNLEYIPKLSHKEIEENHKHFSQRVSVYKSMGLDFVSSREFILQKSQPLTGSILEIGSGTGYTTLVLARAGYKFVSIDKDKESLKIAALNLAYDKLLSNVRFYIMDAKSMSFPEASFRNIVCVNLFHHIYGVNKLLVEIDRLLGASGKAVLADFNKQGMAIVNSVHRQEGRVHEDSDVQKDSVYDYFERLGYEVQDYQHKHHWLLIAKRINKKLKG